MDALSLLRKAREAGLTVSTRGTKLVVRGPRRAEPVARLLLKHKPVVMAALGHPGPERVGWGAADWRGFYAERAAIREYDGQRPRAEAERLAWGELLVAWHRTHGVRPPTWQCAGCAAPLSGAEVFELADTARVHDAPDFTCLIAYGRRWRAAAQAGLAALGLEPPRSA